MFGYLFVVYINLRCLKASGPGDRFLQFVDSVDRIVSVHKNYSHLSGLVWTQPEVRIESLRCCRDGVLLSVMYIYVCGVYGV